ncbi:hypothetical protein GLYMA_04G189400v4 [Glycine max]|uniref:Uncharacterized protein n=1 Tax=Glycine max TaxID=3847 RepID=A0A0R0KJ18_SOYBN|nr:hypothetical protein GYH30_010416 [Glycine max]KRH63652.1 hypothetical protein GLYMA_04G189400v4 [Glycine max]
MLTDPIHSTTFSNIISKENVGEGKKTYHFHGNHTILSHKILLVTFVGPSCSIPMERTSRRTMVDSTKKKLSI